jgi:predicted nucleic acid-binding protein
VGSVVLDASVVIALLDSSDASHVDARALLEGRAEDTWLMSTGTLAEVLVHPLRRGTGDEFERKLARLRVAFVDVDPAIARRAARLRAEHMSLRVPDSLVLATAQQRAADTLTFDRALRRLDQRS